MSVRGSGADWGKERAGDKRRAVLVAARRRVGRCIVGFSGRVVGWDFLFGWGGGWSVVMIDGSFRMESERRRRRVRGVIYTILACRRRGRTCV